MTIHPKPALPLFEIPATPHAQARTSDPETSKQAARAIAVHLGPQLARVLELIRRYPGRTGRELADIDGGDRYVIARRGHDLRELGRVRNGTPRKCRVTGTRQLTWYAVEEGPR